MSRPEASCAVQVYDGERAALLAKPSTLPFDLLQELSDHWGDLRDEWTMGGWHVVPVHDSRLMSLDLVLQNPTYVLVVAGCFDMLQQRPHGLLEVCMGQASWLTATVLLQYVNLHLLKELLSMVVAEAFGTTCTASLNGTAEGNLTECLSGFYVRVLVHTFCSDLLERDLQDVMERTIATAHLDKHPALHQPDLLTVYSALGSTIAKSKQFECWDAHMRWKRIMLDATAKAFPEHDPTCFHFARVNPAMERETATIGGWKSQLVLDGLEALPPGHRVLSLKILF